MSENEEATKTIVKVEKSLKEETVEEQQQVQQVQQQSSSVIRRPVITTAGTIEQPLIEENVQEAIVQEHEEQTLISQNVTPEPHIAVEGIPLDGAYNQAYMAPSTYALETYDEYSLQNGQYVEILNSGTEYRDISEPKPDPTYTDLNRVAPGQSIATDALGYIHQQQQQQQGQRGPPIIYNDPNMGMPQNNQVRKFNCFAFFSSYNFLYL